MEQLYSHCKRPIRSEDDDDEEERRKKMMIIKVLEAKANKKEKKKRRAKRIQLLEEENERFYHHARMPDILAVYVEGSYALRWQKGTFFVVARRSIIAIGATEITSSIVCPKIDLESSTYLQCVSLDYLSFVV